MPACGHCGKDNPEGTAFCGYCASPLTQSAIEPVAPKPTGRAIVAPQIRGGSPPPSPPKPFKPEIRTPISPASGSGGGKGKGGFELLPWSELSSGQRAGRVAAGAIVLFLILFFLRGMLRGVGGSGANGPALSPDSSNAAITDGDRRDGIESLCKVFQIYGLPKNDSGATEAVHNAGELFKLAGNQSPERSTYILTTIVGDFRSGKLGRDDCAQAGAPIAVNPPDSTDNSSPDVQRNQ
jgi:hypothetical protein